MAQKKYRVLRALEIDGVAYKPDAVISLDEQAGKLQEGAGALDGNAAAVEYCEKELAAKAVTHKKPAAETAEASK